MGSFVAGQVISKSVGEVSSAVGKLDFGDSRNTSSPKQSHADSVEDYAELLKYKGKLKEQHWKRELKRQTLRRDIRLKHGIKESDRHKANLGPNFGVVKSEKAKLFVNGDEDKDECRCCSCWTCFSCCFCK